MTADSPPAQFPILQVFVLLVAMLGGAGLFGVLLKTSTGAKPTLNPVAAEEPLAALVSAPL